MCIYVLIKQPYTQQGVHSLHVLCVLHLQPPADEMGQYRPCRNAASVAENFQLSAAQRFAGWALLGAGVASFLVNLNALTPGHFKLMRIQSTLMV
jgi:hypothetical protein